MELTQDVTPDLCDAHPDKVRILPPIFTSYGANPRFFGEVATVSCYEDNTFVKEYLSRPGNGRVLVVDGGGSLRKALLGDLIAASAVSNGWSGVVINGCIRDVSMIASMAIGIRALNSIPVKTEKLGRGEIDVPLHIGGVDIHPGNFLYADQTGILISDEPLTLT